jgi:hypothetical protein
MVSVLVSRAVYRGLYPLSDRSKYLKSGICCFFALQAALRSKMSKNKSILTNKLLRFNYRNNIKLIKKKVSSNTFIRG